MTATALKTSPVNSNKSTALAISLNEFLYSLQTAQEYVCHDETRFHLNGVYFIVREKHLVLQATNGHAAIEIEMGGLVQADDFKAILPESGLDTLVTLLKAGIKANRMLKESPIAITSTDQGVTFNSPALSQPYTIKPIDAKFPPMESVIPKLRPVTDQPEPDFGGQIGLNPTILAYTAKAAITFSGKNAAMSLQLGEGGLDPVRVDLQSPDGNKAVIVIMPMRR